MHSIEEAPITSARTMPRSAQTFVGAVGTAALTRWQSVCAPATQQARPCPLCSPLVVPAVTPHASLPRPLSLPAVPVVTVPAITPPGLPVVPTISPLSRHEGSLHHVDWGVGGECIPYP